jgi:hypothetical protein
MIYMGATYPPKLRDLCCFSSAKQIVFSGNIGDRSLHAYSVLAATTREVGVVRGKDAAAL